MTDSQIRRLEPEMLLDVLMAHAVDYLVVGGFAVAAHGFPRATKDIDICPEPSDANLGHLVAALEELGAEPIGLDEFEGEWQLGPEHQARPTGCHAEQDPMAEKTPRLSVRTWCG